MFCKLQHVLEIMPVLQASRDKNIAPRLQTLVNLAQSDLYSQAGVDVSKYTLLEKIACEITSGFDGLGSSIDKHKIIVASIKIWEMLYSTIASDIENSYKIQKQAKSIPSIDNKNYTVPIRYQNFFDRNKLEIIKQLEQAVRESKKQINQVYKAEKSESDIFETFFDFERQQKDNIKKIKDALIAIKKSNFSSQSKKEHELFADSLITLIHDAIGELYNYIEKYRLEMQYSRDKFFDRLQKDEGEQQETVMHKTENNIKRVIDKLREQIRYTGDLIARAKQKAEKLNEKELFAYLPQQIIIEKKHVPDWRFGKVQSVTLQQLYSTRKFLEAQLANQQRAYKKIYETD